MQSGSASCLADTTVHSTVKVALTLAPELASDNFEKDECHACHANELRSDGDMTVFSLGTSRSLWRSRRILLKTLGRLPRKVTLNIWKRVQNSPQDMKQFCFMTRTTVLRKGSRSFNQNFSRVQETTLSAHPIPAWHRC